MDSKIIRIVNGHHADPKSTRDLFQVSEEELEHIRMSCEAGMLEAETYLAMGDDELKATFEGNLMVFSKAGLCLPCPAPEIDAQMRQYLRTRYRVTGTLLRKIGKARGGAVRGITPSEYEHLVTTLQAGYREAEVCSTLTNELLALAYANASQTRELLGLGFENPYAAYCSDYLEFFQERAEILWDVLRCVNQPYAGEDGDPEFAIFA